MFALVNGVSEPEFGRSLSPNSCSGSLLSWQFASGGPSKTPRNRTHDGSILDPYGVETLQAFSELTAAAKPLT